MISFAKPFLIAVLTAVASPSLAEMRLVMVEEPGCAWCARWNEEIGPIYPKSEVGKSAPLQRMDIREREPDDLEFARGLHFTPTFVLMVDGEEVGRIEGYPGEDFFWGLLEQMVDEAQTTEESLG